MIVVAFALMAFGPRQTSDVSGVYRELKYVEESGDLLGMEVEIRAAQPHPSVVVTICEGGCYGGQTSPVVIDGNQISFTVLLKSTDSHGRPADPAFVKFEGTIQGDELILYHSASSSSHLVKDPHPKPGQTARLAVEA